MLTDTGKSLEVVTGRATRGVTGRTNHAWGRVAGTGGCARLAGLVMEYGGVIDDFCDGAIKGDFGVPVIRTPEVQYRQACGARRALAMRGQLDTISGQCSVRGLPRARMRAGICSGYVVAGLPGQHHAHELHHHR